MVSFTFVPEKMDTARYNSLRSSFYTRAKEGNTVMLDNSSGMIHWDCAVERGQLYLNVISMHGIHRFPIYRISAM